MAAFEDDPVGGPVDDHAREIEAQFILKEADDVVRCRIVPADEVEPPRLWRHQVLATTQHPGEDGREDGADRQQQDAIRRAGLVPGSDPRIDAEERHDCRQRHRQKHRKLANFIRLANHELR
mgnify:CR=1 FL=1